ncbi:MAG: hypothetical protein JF598_06555 [Streptomyces sp.]|nr:hypothetical protein [Streptomyces sp.]
MSDAGALLFARYAYAPNELGYCGPADADALFELGVTGRTDADVAAIARRFSGAWPYAALLAELSGVDDPLDEQVMRAYWTGGALLDRVDTDVLGRRLLEYIASQAGHYWAHLTPELLPEASPTHGFHVFSVYPWSRLLVGDDTGQPLRVLDDCRIRWGRVVECDATHVVVRSQRLGWDGTALALLDEADERVRRVVAGRGFVADPQPGEWLALHWDWVCDRLTDGERDELCRRTEWQLARTNERLARDR